MTIPLITTETDTADEQRQVAAYRQAVEALAATTALISGGSDADDTAQQIFDALIEDLDDGVIEGMPACHAGGRGFF